MQKKFIATMNLRLNHRQLSTKKPTDFSRLFLRQRNSNQITVFSLRLQLEQQRRQLEQRQAQQRRLEQQQVQRHQLEQRQVQQRQLEQQRRLEQQQVQLRQLERQQVQQRRLEQQQVLQQQVLVQLQQQVLVLLFYRKQSKPKPTEQQRGEIVVSLWLPFHEKWTRLYKHITSSDIARIPCFT